MARGKNTRTVYSTESGRICPDCGHPVGECRCKEKTPPANGPVRITEERKGRRGKTVTVIAGLPLDHDGLLSLARELKGKCGAGGTVTNGTIEIQGGHRSSCMEFIRKKMKGDDI